MMHSKIFISSILIWLLEFSLADFIVMQYMKRVGEREDDLFEQ